MPAGEGGRFPFAVSFYCLQPKDKCISTEVHKSRGQGWGRGGAQLGDCFPSMSKALHNLQHNLNSAWWDMPVILALGWGVEAEKDENFKVSLDYKIC